MTGINVGVHVHHCCEMHGCKYGKNDICPVKLGTHEQEYPCEDCGNPAEIKAKLEERTASLAAELAWAEKLEARGLDLTYASGARYM
jgi:hypothetical protein